jgi:hypothetical protein
VKPLVKGKLFTASKVFETSSASTPVDEPIAANARGGKIKGKAMPAGPRLPSAPVSMPVRFHPGPGAGGTESEAGWSERKASMKSEKAKAPGEVLSTQPVIKPALPRPRQVLPETVPSWRFQIASGTPPSGGEAAREHKIADSAVQRETTIQPLIKTASVGLPELPRVPPARVVPEAPSIQVKIGTVEVKAHMPPSPPTIAAPPHHPPGFEDYARIRSYLNWEG